MSTGFNLQLLAAVAPKKRLSLCLSQALTSSLALSGDRDQDNPHGKEMQKSKMAVWGGLTNNCEKKRSEK